MINTMPVLTESERKELTEYLTACVENRCVIMPISDTLRLDRLRNQIALAALSVKPKDFLGISDDDAEYNGIRHFSFKPNTIIDLYRAPPVSALKMPDEIRLHGDMDEIYVSAWNACLAETKRLNGVTE